MERTTDSQAPWFTTAAGREVPSVTAEQMREIDRIAMEETGPNLFQMMENAGRSLAEMTLECLGDDWRQARIVVLAGSGGNGGGGISAAHHLANRFRVLLSRVLRAMTASSVNVGRLANLKPGKSKSFCVGPIP